MFYQTDEIDFYYYSTEEEIEKFAIFLEEEIYKSNYTALDCETYSSKELYQENSNALDANKTKVRLLQMKIDHLEFVYILDFLNISEKLKLRIIQILYDYHIKDGNNLVIQNALYEYTVFLTNFKIFFFKLKDLFVAAQTNDVSNGFKAGTTNGRSLKSLTENYFLISRNKEEGVSDWERKDLFKSQLVYAALDVGCEKNTFKPSFTANKLFTKEICQSVLIDLYKLFEKNSVKVLKQKEAFYLDQSLLPGMGEIELNGLPLNVELAKTTIKSITLEKNNIQRKLAKELGFSLRTVPVKVNGKLKNSLKFPKELETLLNHSPSFIKYLEEVLKIQLETLDKKYIVKYLSSLDLKKEKGEGGETGTEIKEYDSSDNDKFFDSDIDLNITCETLNLYLKYKEYSKFLIELSKFVTKYDPKNKNVRTGGLYVCGTSTSRMAGKGTTGKGLKINLQAIPTTLFQVGTNFIELGFKDESYFKDKELFHRFKDRKFYIKDSLRRLISVPDNHHYVMSFDFSGQELCIAAAVSRDERMLNTLKRKKNNKFLLDNQGNPIKNKDGNYIIDASTDLHVVAAYSLFPELLQANPEDRYNLASSKRTAAGLKYRACGKILNFSSIYGKSAAGFAEDFGVSIDEAKEILKKYFGKDGFQKLGHWLKQAGDYGKKVYRMRNLYGEHGRLIFCAEDNAKGLGGDSTIARKAPNTVIQGTASDMTKLSFKYYIEDEELREYRMASRLYSLGVVHDECNFYFIADEIWYVDKIKFFIVDEESKKEIEITDLEEIDNLTKDQSDRNHTKVFIKPSFYIPESVKEVGNKIQKLMLKAENDILDPLINEEFPSEADSAIGPFWIH